MLAAAAAPALRVVVDFGFDEHMSGKERQSVAAQCAGCWAALRRAERPLALALASCEGEAAARLAACGAGRWEAVTLEPASVFDRPARWVLSLQGRPLGPACTP